MKLEELLLMYDNKMGKVVVNDNNLETIVKDVSVCNLEEKKEYDHLLKKEVVAFGAYADEKEPYMEYTPVRLFVRVK